jgi:hypothetical protein
MVPKFGLELWALCILLVWTICGAHVYCSFSDVCISDVLISSELISCGIYDQRRESKIKLVNNQAKKEKFICLAGAYYLFEIAKFHVRLLVLVTD